MREKEWERGREREREREREESFCAHKQTVEYTHKEREKVARQWDKTKRKNFARQKKSKNKIKREGRGRQTPGESECLCYFSFWRRISFQFVFPFSSLSFLTSIQLTIFTFMLCFLSFVSLFLSGCLTFTQVFVFVFVQKKNSTTNNICESNSLSKLLHKNKKEK